MLLLLSYTSHAFKPQDNLTEKHSMSLHVYCSHICTSDLRTQMPRQSNIISNQVHVNKITLLLETPSIMKINRSISFMNMKDVYFENQHITSECQSHKSNSYFKLISLDCPNHYLKTLCEENKKKKLIENRDRFPLST